MKSQFPKILYPCKGINPICLIDPIGHSWAVATHKEDVGQDELHRRGQEEMAKWAKETHA